MTKLALYQYLSSRNDKLIASTIGHRENSLEISSPERKYHLLELEMARRVQFGRMHNISPINLEDHLIKFDEDNELLFLMTYHQYA